MALAGGGRGLAAPVGAAAGRMEVVGAVNQSAVLLTCPAWICSNNKGAAASSVYRKRAYYFCMDAHKKMFDANPASFN
jgi:hypothetical protein